MSQLGRLDGPHPPGGPPDELDVLVVSAIPALGQVSPDVRRLVGAAMTRQTFAFGEVLVRADEPADALFIIISGTVRVVSRGRLRQ